MWSDINPGDPSTVATSAKRARDPNTASSSATSWAPCTSREGACQNDVLRDVEGDEFGVGTGQNVERSASRRCRRARRARRRASAHHELVARPAETTGFEHVALADLEVERVERDRAAVPHPANGDTRIRLIGEGGQASALSRRIDMRWCDLQEASRSSACWEGEPGSAV